MRKTKITIDVELDDNHVPEKITWNAEDGGVENSPAKAALISVWDDKEKEALRLDLWTKDMPMDDMKVFLHQIFVSLAETYQRATNEDEAAQAIIELAENFAVKAGISSGKHL